MTAPPRTLGVLASVGLLAACSDDRPPEDDDAPSDLVVGDNTEFSDSSDSPEGPWMSVKVIQESGDVYYFTPTDFLGSWTESSWTLEAFDGTVGPGGLRVLDFTIGGPMAVTSSVIGREEVSGTFGVYADFVTYVGAVLFFETTSGTLTLTRIDVSVASGRETRMLYGEFDVHWASVGLVGLEPHMIGTFGNIDISRSL
jgi:hypothetical protein